MQRKIFLMASAFMFALPFFVSAQETEKYRFNDEKSITDIRTETVSVANVDLSDARVISQDESGAITFSFSIKNNGDFPQSGIRYGVELVKRSEKDQVTVDVFVGAETIALSPRKSVMKEFTYTAPTFLSGEYEIWLVLRAESGLIFSLRNMGKQFFPDSVRFVELIPGSCIAGTEVPIIVSCSVKNRLPSAIEISPYLETYRSSVYGESVMTGLLEQRVSLLAEEERIVRFVVPTMPDSHRYETRLTLIDTETKAPISNAAVFAYSVEGRMVRIDNAMIDRTSYVRGDNISAKIFWSGNGKESVTATLSVIDRKTGAPCLDPVLKEAPFVGQPLVLTSTVSETCASPEAKVSLLGVDGKLLDSWLITTSKETDGDEHPASTGAVNTEGDSQYIFYAFIGGLSLIGLFLIVKRFFIRRRGVLRSILLLGYFVCGFSGTDAEALTWGGDYTLSFSASTDKIFYNPGESISITGSIAAPYYPAACLTFRWGLTTPCAYVTFLLQSQTAPIIMHDKTAPFFWSTTLTAPSAPGDYVIAINHAVSGIYGDLWHYNEPVSGLPITVNAVPVPPTVFLGPFSPSTIVAGQSSTISFSSTNATSCAGSGIWNGNVGTSANNSNTGLMNVPGTYTQTVTCIGPGGSATSATRALTVNAAVVPIDGVCGISNGGTYATAPSSGLCSSGASTGVLDLGFWSWSCLGSNGGSNVFCSASKPFVPPAPTLSLSATPTTVVAGGSSTLTWATTNAQSCWATGNWTGWKTASGGTEPMSALTAGTKTYVLECWNSAGVSSGQRTATVTVSAPNVLQVCREGSPVVQNGGTYGPFAMPQNTSTTFTVHFDATPGNCEPASNVTASAVFTEANPAGGPVSFSGTNPKTLSAGAISGSESTTVSYSGQGAILNAQVTCVETVNCTDETAAVCRGEFIPAGTTKAGTCGPVDCGNLEGTRYCDFNWKEVAPGQ